MGEMTASVIGIQTAYPTTQKGISSSSVAAGTSCSATAGFPFFPLRSSSSRARSEKDDEERGGIAMPVVFPVTGDEFNIIF